MFEEVSVDRFDVKHNNAWTGDTEYKVRFWIDGVKYAVRLSEKDFNRMAVPEGAVIPIAKVGHEKTYFIATED